MKAFIPIITSVIVIFFVLSCHSSVDKQIDKFQNMPDSAAKRYVDSLAWFIDKSIPLQQKGFPTNKKGKSYFEERPYFDATRRLKKVTVYEFRSDSFISYTDYHYWQGKFIKMRKNVAGSGRVLGVAYYIFKGNKLIDSSVVYLNPIPADSLIARAEDFRKRFERQ